MRRREAPLRTALLLGLAFSCLGVIYMTQLTAGGPSAAAGPALAIELDKAAYGIGMPVHITVQLTEPELLLDTGSMELQIMRLTEPAARLQLPADPGQKVWRSTWQPPAEPAGYGVRAVLHGPRGPLATSESAFDVTGDWTEIPRYGFMSEFGTWNEESETRAVQSMARLHLNAVQFYDWLYRHETPVPTSDVFTDSLGRRLYADTIRRKIDLSRRYGMAPMAYVAIYAASPAFYEQHKDWGLYDREGQPIDFGDGYLYIMNPAQGSGWREHMIREWLKIVETYDFDGLHIDQYGYPKVAYDARGRTVMVGPAFRSFLDETKEKLAEQMPQRSRITFNSVANWPAALVAESSYDFNYIEVWPPYTTYGDLETIIQASYERSGGKATVIAAYPDRPHEPTVLLLDAFIFAHGATHIELGEGNGMLVDPYFPKFQRVDASLWQALIRYYDFIVWYKDWLYGARRPLSPEKHVLIDGEAAAPRPVPGRVHAVIYRSLGTPRTVVSLINLTSTHTVEWKAEQPAPRPAADLEVTVLVDHRPTGVWLASPDRPSLAAQPVNFTTTETPDGYAVQFAADVAYWTVICIETAGGQSEGGDA